MIARDAGVTEQDNLPSTEERIFGALGYGSVFLPLFGLIIPLVVWVVHRTKSGYVAFQALQALGFHILSFTLALLMAFIMPFFHVAVLMVELSIMQRAGAPADQTVLPVASIVISWGVLLAGVFAYCLTGLIGALVCLLGRDFRLPLLGKWLGRYLGYHPGAFPEDDPADRWVAAMAHAAIVINLWGMVLPLLVWFTERKRSPLLQFQALQALVFQVFGVILMFAAYFVYLFSMVLVFVGTLIVSSSNDSGGVVVLMILVLAVFLVFIVIALALPLLQIYGQWAAIRVLQGREYRYPVFGRLVRSWLDRQPAA